MAIFRCARRWARGCKAHTHGGPAEQAEAEWEMTFEVTQPTSARTRISSALGLRPTPDEPSIWLRPSRSR